MRRVIIVIIALLLSSGAQAQFIAPKVPSYTTTPPPGSLHLNLANPLTRGVQFIWAASQSQNPVANAGYQDLSGGAASQLQFFNGATIGLCQRGACLTGNANNSFGRYTSTGTSTPLVSGTILAFVTASWSPTDGVTHDVFAQGNPAFPAGPNMECLKFSDNNWYCGWYFGTVSRVGPVAASGSFTAGDSFVVGCTYTTGTRPDGTTGTKFFVKGKQLGINSSAAVTSNNTGAPGLVIGNLNNTFPATGWSTTLNRDGIYWLAIWNRELSASEIALLQADPNGLFLTSDDELFNSMFVGTPVVGPNGGGLVRPIFTLPGG